MTLQPHTLRLAILAAYALFWLIVGYAVTSAFGAETDDYGFEIAPAQYLAAAAKLPPPLIVPLPFGDLQPACARYPRTLAAMRAQGRHFNGCTIPPRANWGDQTARLIPDSGARAHVQAAIAQNRCVILIADNGWLSEAQAQALIDHHEIGHCAWWLHPRIDL